MKMRFHVLPSLLILGCLATASLSVAVMAEGITPPAQQFPSVKLEKSSRISVLPQISPEQFDARTSAMPVVNDDRSAALEDALADKSYLVYSAMLLARPTAEEEGQDEDDSSTLPEYAPSAVASSN